LGLVILLAALWLIAKGAANGAPLEVQRPRVAKTAIGLSVDRRLNVR
jgi:hypothetical protein